MDELMAKIERFLKEYDGTAIGQEVKNMIDNSTPYDKIEDYIENYI